MTVYVVHAPRQAARGSAEGLEKTVLVKDGFHWLAFLFPMLWPLLHRMWWVFLAVLATVLALGVGGRALDAPGWAVGLLELLMAVLMGVFAADLRGWTLSRRGFSAVDVVGGRDREEAERRFFTRWLAGASRPPAPRPPASYPAAPPPGGVTGLFPEPGRVRS
ncbi:DUF2628 domain-containing protein [Alsobacter sp. SYSU M60028]|uniref:DUF2628 domain-containing protein n=1 Tax=Alsobacter ponti TaxID=2962936 RepID=A0ABT1LDR8_9HYPH|nr:DUF2628 domain-containing protein [Alsobacter ponti]MCP8938870.1 DUF2628 domain-containing protein [Alsobacter ponti]